MRRQEGVTLIEVVISIALLGIVAASIVGYFNWSFGLFNRVDVQTTAESLARSQMEEIKTAPFDPTGAYPTLTAPPQFSITVSATNVSGNVTESLQPVSVNVVRSFFTEAGVEQTENLTLQGYKLKR